MADNGSELRRIVWSEAFPFVRLFRTLPLALNANRLVLALAAVLLSYIGGRVQDWAWPDKSDVRADLVAGTVVNNIERYATAGRVGLMERAFAPRDARPTAEQQTEIDRPRGVYISLLTFEMRCLAGAAQGAYGGQWGFAGGADEFQPALLGSLATGARGVCWLVTQRPRYALVCGLFNLLVFALFGGALCRSAAVDAARGESLPLGECLRFGRRKLGSLLLAPLLPLAVVFGVAVVLGIGGLVGAIPWLGELLTGLLYFLALLGGFAAALALLLVVLGFPLMWPTIAAEGSDGFDALSRAGHYVSGRIWHCGFYVGVLLIYGALSLVLVRGVAVITLKVTHDFSGLGMRVADGSKVEKVAKLDALWQMPTWSETALLPTATATPFWGTFYRHPLNWTETIGAFGIAAWVHLVVALVAAFAVSFFFCGSTQMYFLLRRDVDATDWEEVCYEEADEEEGPATAAVPTSFVTESPAPAATPPTPPSIEPPPPPPSDPPPTPPTL